MYFLMGVLVACKKNNLFETHLMSASIHWKEIESINENGKNGWHHSKEQNIDNHSKSTQIEI